MTETLSKIAIKNKQLIEDIENLKNLLQKTGSERNEARAVLSNLQRELSDILTGNMELDSYSRSTFNRDILDWSKIKNRISNLKGQLFTEGRVMPIVERGVLDENAKLWYLVRVAMGDITRTEPQDPEKLESKFKEPNFG